MTPLRLTCLLVVLTGALLGTALFSEPSPATLGDTSTARSPAAFEPLAILPSSLAAEEADREDLPALGAEPRPLPAHSLSGHFGPTVPEGGRSAELRGTIRVDGLGARATLRFLDGPNAGAELVTADDGSFLWEDLYPGFGVLQSEAGWSCTREIVLRHARPTTHELDLGDHGVVSGTLVDEEDEPVAFAPFTLDGHAGLSDARGRFAAEVPADGEALLVVRQPGFVAYREHLRAPSTSTREHRIELHRGMTLELTMGDLPDEREAIVYLLPTNGERTSGATPRSAFPWHEVNALRMRSREHLVLPDMPKGRLEARVFHPAARGTETVWLQDPLPVRGAVKGPVSLFLNVEPLPSLEVLVLRDGEPVPGATLELRTANPLASTLGALGTDGERLLRTQALEFLPGAIQRVNTDSQGAGLLGRDPRVTGERFVTVTTPQGELSVTRALQRHAERLVVDLHQLGV